MEILRVPPYPLTASYSSLTIDTAHLLRMHDSRSGLVATATATSDGSGDITFTLPTSVSDYDAEFSATIHEGALSTDPVVASDNINVVRPYLVPADITPDGGSVADYTSYERTARISIDNIVGGFYFKDLTMNLLGMGNDKLTIGQRVNNIVSVVRNNEMVYERDGADNTIEYTLTDDSQSMITLETTAANVIDSKPPTIPFSSSDYGGYGGRIVDFPTGWDYSVRIESGWNYVPQDIKEATQLLIDDIVCQSPNYVNRYVREYETKDYRVDIHRPAFAGTGNLIVDQTLQKYLGDTLYDGVRVL
jgi:hypothetical protein